MKKLSTLLITGLTIFFAFSSFAQTVTIDYSYANLTDSCNVFATPKIYQSYSHLTSFGFPYFSKSDDAIILQSKPISLTIKGATHYAIRYNFKQGFTYQIKLYGKSTLGGTSSGLPSAAINWSNDSAGVNSSFNCTGPVSRSSAFDINYGHIAFTTGWNWSPNILIGVASQNFTYLLVAAVPADGTYQYDDKVSLTLVRKIQIVEIPPTSAFSITPTESSLTCGSIIPMTFTVKNNTNITGVTNYTWNLGAIPNGWFLANGSSAAASFSSGTTDSLTLTPSCVDVKKNISVTVTAGGINYQTNTSSVVNTSPVLSISSSGSGSLCTGTRTYTVSGVPCNATVSWTSSNTGIATISPSGNPATLTKVGNGDITITATIAGINCLSNNTVSTPVNVGTPQASNITLWSSSGSTTVGNPVGFVAGYPPNSRCQIQATEWQVSMDASISSGNFPCESDNETSKNIFFQSTGTAYVQAHIQNGCGWSDWSAGLPIEVSSGYYFMISPNPTSSEITVKQKDKATVEIAEIKLFDNNGNLKKQSKYAEGTKQVQLNISGLNRGIYIIEISGSQYKERQQLVIQK